MYFSKSDSNFYRFGERILFLYCAATPALGDPDPLDYLFFTDESATKPGLII